MKNAYILIVLVCASLFLAGCAAKETPTPTPAAQARLVSVPGGSFEKLTAEELNQKLDAKDFTLVNVHIPFEGDLPKTDVSIPYDQIGQHLDQLPGGKDAKIVLYCRSGRMSTIAAEKLVELGYTHIAELDGGMIAWEQAGFPIKR